MGRAKKTRTRIRPKPRERTETARRTERGSRVRINERPPRSIRKGQDSIVSLFFFRNHTVVSVPSFRFGVLPPTGEEAQLASFFSAFPFAYLSECSSPMYLT